MLAFFLAMPLPHSDHSRSPNRSGSRGRTVRWSSRVGNLGGGGTVNASRGPRLSSEYMVGEEESALEASARLSASSSSLADAAIFFYR